jgi:hypothetical protein
LELLRETVAPFGEHPGLRRANAAN